MMMMMMVIIERTVAEAFFFTSFSLDWSEWVFLSERLALEMSITVLLLLVETKLLLCTAGT
jgi:hypothetical protein